MDVIGRDDLPTDTKASATKLSNGNATLSEDNATVGVGVARKKTKRKSKAKNSQREDAPDSVELKIEAPSATKAAAAAAVAEEKLSSTAAGVTLPTVAASMVGTQATGRRGLNGESVNSNSSALVSSSHRSSHSNGLPAEDALDDSSIGAISEKLEQCVQLNCNGLTNGLPKQDDKSPQEENEEDEGELRKGTVNSSSGSTVKEPATKSSKKKHRSNQAKKAQTVEAKCIVNGVVGHTDGQRETEEPIRERQMASASKQRTVPEAQNVGAQSGNNVPSIPNAPTSSAISPLATSSASNVDEQEAPAQVAAPVHITYQLYESERQMPAIMSLIQKDLSEPYSIYTYRYFIHNWPKLCFLALHEDACVGAIVCKLDIHRQDTRRGYIAMLAVDKDYRKLKIGTTLVQKAIQAMVEDNADEVVLETEITNQPALRLYENLGFVRDKRLFHYYLNGVDALRLKLWFR